VFSTYKGVQTNSFYHEDTTKATKKVVHCRGTGLPDCTANSDQFFSGQSATIRLL